MVAVKRKWLQIKLVALISVFTCWAPIAAAFTTSIDNSIPVAILTNQRDMTFTFSASIPNAHFACSLNGSDLSTCSSPWSYAQLPDGDYIFKVHAFDPTGTYDKTGDTHQWTIDTVPPKTSLAATQTSVSTLIFALSANKPGSQFFCAVDNNPGQPCQTPLTISNLPVGSHSLFVQAQDPAGNLDPVGVSHNFTVRPPVTTLLTNASPGAQFTNKTGISFAYTSNHGDANFVCALNSSAPTACAPTAAYASLPDGQYTFRVQAVDIFGSVDPVGALHSWIVDTVPPVATLSKMDTTSTSIVVSWTTDEPASAKLLWGFNGSTDREVPDDGTMQTTHTVRLNGLSSYTVYSLAPAGFDRAGNPYQMTTQTVRTRH